MHHWPLQEKNIKHNGNLTLEDVYEVARVMRDRSCAATFSGTVKEMLGTCVSGELWVLISLFRNVCQTWSVEGPRNFSSIVKEMLGTCLFGGHLRAAVHWPACASCWSAADPLIAHGAPLATHLSHHVSSIVCSWLHCGARGPPRHPDQD